MNDKNNEQTSWYVTRVLAAKNAGKVGDLALNYLGHWRSTGCSDFLDADVVVGDGENAFLVGQVCESLVALLAHGDARVEVLVLQLRPVRVDQRHQRHVRLHGHLDAVHRLSYRLGLDRNGNFFAAAADTTCIVFLVVRLLLVLQLTRLGLFWFCTFHRRLFKSGQRGFSVFWVDLLVFRWRLWTRFPCKGKQIMLQIFSYFTSTRLTENITFFVPTKLIFILSQFLIVERRGNNEKLKAPPVALKRTSKMLNQQKLIFVCRTFSNNARKIKL